MTWRGCILKSSHLIQSTSDLYWVILAQQNKISITSPLRAQTEWLNRLGILKVNAPCGWSGTIGYRGNRACAPAAHNILNTHSWHNILASRSRVYHDIISVHVVPSLFIVRSVGCTNLQHKTTIWCQKRGLASKSDLLYLKPNRSVTSIASALRPKPRWWNSLVYKFQQWIGIGESSLLTTFNSPFETHRFLCSPFGLICEQDVFQRKVD